MIINIETPTQKINNLLSIQNRNKPLSPDQIAKLKDGDIVLVQWPCEEGATPYRIQTRLVDGSDRPWIYATDINPYHESPCLWHREISGFGKFTPGGAPYDLKVWEIKTPDRGSPIIEKDVEVFQTIQW